MRPVAIALGSNLGDRHAALTFAIDRLGAFLSNIVVSHPIETEPEGEGLEHQPQYLNAALVGTTTLDARALLDALMTIEQDFGRERPFPGAARTLDLDLILFDDLVLEEPDLQLPHPRFRTRFFVLGPLAEIAAGMRDPVTGLSIAELLQRLLSDPTR